MFFCACVVMLVNDSNSTNKKGKKKKDKREKKNQIKLPGNEAYNFFFIDCFKQMVVYSVF